MGYEDSGEFTFRERLKTSIHKNMTYYATVGAIGLFGIILIIIMRHDWVRGILGFSMACSNTFGLVTGAFLLGFGLSEIPRNVWRSADWTHRLQFLSHRVSKMATKLDHAHQEYCNAIFVVQATSNQMSKRDPLRPCMDMINNTLTQMLQDDPLFKPSGGKLGEHDMDYDSDNKTMATLRRQLRKAHEEYYRRKSDYMTCVVEALELEDTIRNYEQRDASGWKYLSSFRESRSGTLGSFLDSIEFIWRCLLRKQFMRVLAVILGCVSASILLAEATLLPSDVDLSLFSNLINAGKQEVLVQVAAFVPLMYMCICTYYSLIRIGMMLLYSLTPGQTSSVSLLMICSMVARYAPPISYNFLNLIHLGGNAKTTFEKRMGNIDDVVPFFGRTFNKIYPLIMVVYTLLVAVNFFEHLIDFFGSLKRFKCWTDQEGDMDGLDPSGVFILQKERSSMEQGRKVSEHAAPLARNFSCLGEDVESGNIPQGDGTVETEPERTAAQPKHGGDVAQSQRYSPAREQCSSPKPVEVQKGISSTSKSNEPPCVSAAADSPAETASRWASMKTGFQNLRATMGGSRKFLLLGLSPRAGTNESATESLDEIFRKLKRHSSNADANRLDDDDGLPF
ncbi:LMBR1 domain-containing protein 2 homolog isoform X2 [Zea mays]|uniref:LMBR1 domain-containing protein 2 homolog isoform X2 n=1 Tax=Zea mays TaxID=4577 RepID=UPI0009AA3A73|nr:LMBR1 domain-containing protein 2 homolog isoform X2 [Zea mays]|eukprot:XP_020395041.1 LMBR1 domain-containing protein 2 homolog isoform X2 [Zea mays]